VIDERWGRVKSLFQAAAERPAGERDAFLAAAPGVDDDLRREVRSLLRVDATDSVFDRLPLAGAAALAAVPLCPALTAGFRIGPYVIDCLIGAGSMGEVYRARDTRLNRDVAVKILPADLAGDLDRLARFRREAHVLATLNHPNIAAIYGFEESDGLSALVLEFIDGPTLAERIAGRPLPLGDALRLARQIADALAAAHDHGIVHRDMKPANIAIDRHGTVKVLDFGLARMSAVDGSQPSPDLTAMDSRGGSVLGTPTYMSPEQARGRPLDRRTDLWSFGCLLFEMLTGRAPFARDTVAETLAAVLEHEADDSLLPVDTPRPVRSLLRRCLEKDPPRRLDSAAVARFEIDAALEAKPEGARRRAVALPAATRGRAIVALAVVALFVLSALLWFPLVRSDSGRGAPTARFAIVTPADAPLNLFGPTRDIAFSPDGRTLAYRSGGTQTAGSLLMLRSLDRVEATLVPDVGGVYAPFFSPDGRWVGFFSGSELKKIAVSGGPAMTVCEFSGTPRGASWGDANTITFAVSGAAGGLWRVSADGGKAERLLAADPDGRTNYAFPSVLPAGRAVLFTIEQAGPPANTHVGVLDLRNSQRKTLIPAASDAEYVGSGHLVFASGGSLRAVRFDVGRLEVVGEPVPLSEPVFVKQGGAGDYALTRDGALAYVTAESGTPLPRALVWVDRKGREEPLDVPQRLYGMPRISPDGTRVAVAINEKGSADVWTFDLPAGPMKRLTSSPHTNGLAGWTPDGRQIVFSMADENGVLNLYRTSATGTGRYEPIAPSSRPRWGSSPTHDGNGVFAFDLGPGGRNRVFVLPFAPPARSQAPDEILFEGNFSEISPDGRYVAYQSYETRASEVYVRAFPDVHNGPWRISTAGGWHPAWSRDGRELFFLDAANALHVVRADTSGPTFVSGPPVKVFDTPYFEPNPSRWYDVSPDGQRFLMIKENTNARRGATPANMVVVQNWADELKGRLPR